MLRGEGLFLTYQDGESTIDAVRDVTLTIEDHQFVGILGPSGAGKSSLVERAIELLDSLGLRDKMHRFPYQLSGGERQRVAVARAMVNEPKVIFADEPTGLLDHTTGQQVMNLLIPYRERGSLIVVTHAPEMLPVRTG